MKTHEIEYRVTKYYSKDGRLIAEDTIPVTQRGRLRGSHIISLYDREKRLIKNLEIYDSDTIETHFIYNEAGLRIEEKEIWQKDIRKPEIRLYVFQYNEDQELVGKEVIREDGSLETRYEYDRTIPGIVTTRTYKNNQLHAIREELTEQEGLIIVIDRHSDYNTIGNVTVTDSATGKIIFASNQNNTQYRAEHELDEKGRITHSVTRVCSNTNPITDSNCTFDYIDIVVEDEDSFRIEENKLFYQ